ncbi:unnamed protein product [Phytophthora lilii]|uniref:Unnamed protein product n=1 Tax=Phytophthora lilii TaxID=2077276 RepID=A0A9W6U1A5_9STRA|nr:unnamed protein product [Phytophthora lilii]
MYGKMSYVVDNENNASPKQKYCVTVVNSSQRHPAILLPNDWYGDESDDKSDSDDKKAASPTTESPATKAPSSQYPSTEAPATETPTTISPTTEAPTTEAPTTLAPTTEAPTTVTPTTEVPTSVSSTRETPATAMPATVPPTTNPPTTETPTTAPPTTETPTIASPVDCSDVGAMRVDGAKFSMIQLTFKRSLPDSHFAPMRDAHVALKVSARFAARPARSTPHFSIKAQARTTHQTKFIKMTLSRLEQHMESKYAAFRVYTPETLQKVKVATGITMGYLIQEVGNGSLEDETRLVLIMGYSYRKEEWAPLADGLLTQWEQKYPGKTLKILTLDNRGVGDSDAPWGKYSTSGMAQDTLALLDVIGWKTAHIGGASMGGMISQEIALAAPDRVQSLSLMVTSPGSFTPDASAYPAILTTLVSSDPTKVTNAILSFLYPEPFLASKNGDNGTMRDVFFRYHKEVAAALGAPQSSGTLGQTAALVLHSVSDKKLHKIRDQKFPILIVGAKLDQCINASHSLHFEKVLASDHTNFVLYEDAGHGCFLQHIDEIAGDIMEVIQSPNQPAATS